MEIPILLGANPKTANPVEWIPVRFNAWVPRVEKLVDSEILLFSNEPGKVNVVLTASLNGKVIYGPCLVRAEFVKRGTEKNISIFAKEHHVD
jgi:hypothetical protein